MTEIDLVRQFYDCLAIGDRQGAYSLSSEVFILRQALSLPFGGDYVGTNGLYDFFKKFAAFWKEFKTLNTDYYLSGNRIFAVSQTRGIIRNTERVIETEMIQIYVIANQKLTSAQPFYFDTKLLTD